ncbi:hypothetical protein L228DRAFT_255603 [Xylona heveae TC161]|uniref:C2H2-type domain-containing protein n=1 Tax=Xylona heveae (strain CBS 132557 / TC161) TaxID=1328760 RepID=A0A165IEB9_XYLHT|nr:hypothetical protein L228DRAFT_255603 [Xylona heveae TC161]KZF24774.1 hypothetical protein L228DRAFT_255603 [Xylona heveae TC161]
MEEIVTVDADADANAQGIDPMKHGNLLYTTPGICYDSFHSDPSAPPGPDKTPRLSKGLPRRRSIYRFQRSGPRTAPIFIPNALPGYPDRHETLDPMQRWQQSPPEDEPASLSAIHNAIRNASNVEPNLDRRPSQQGSGSLDSFRSYARAASTTSFDSRSTSSKQSLSSAHSAASEEGFGALRHKRHGRVSKSRCKRGDKMKERRRFQCTFCCDTFRTKYDWARHEKSLHMYLEEWVCAPHGNSIFSPASGRIHCAFCNALDPSPEHLDAHNYKSCRSESTLPRSFKRKDHLVQHLQLTHKLETIPNIEDWKVKAPDIASRCGFCNLHLSNWQNRADHLAAHFRQGSTMDDWHGEHGFEPSIAAKVVNALPTYLIGPESRSLVPFSATSPGCKDHFAQITSRLDTAENVPRGTDSLAAMSSLEEPRVNLSQLDTFGKVLTLHLGQYAREQMTKGVLPTDDMFQREARKVLFDCEDSWNQTIVDNPEWMASFRRQHGWENSNTEPERSASSFER